MGERRFGVYSEVGRLRAVMIHQPGWEHRRMVPWNMQAMLCDDIIDIESARPEHKEFALAMRNHGVEVIYFQDLLRQVCANPEVHEEVVLEVTEGQLPEGMTPRDIQPSHLIMGYPEHFSLREPVILEPLPNLYFMRDPAFFITDKVIISHPNRMIRRREAFLLRAVLSRHPRFEGVEIYDGLLRDPEATIEGGDVLVADERTVLVGISERTNDAGANHLARYLFENTSVERVVKIRIPPRHEFMHLDTVFTFVDRQQIVTLPLIWDRPEIYAEVAQRIKRQVERLGGVYSGPEPEELAAGCSMEVVRADGSLVPYAKPLEGLAELGIIEPKILVTVGGLRQRYSTEGEHIYEALREQWNDGANTVALKPGHVLTYARNDKTIQALEDVMVEVTVFPGGELVRGRGGARCMTMPLCRDHV